MREIKWKLDGNMRLTVWLLKMVETTCEYADKHGPAEREREMKQEHEEQCFQMAREIEFVVQVETSLR